MARSTKTLFQRAREMRGGILESRLVARMETEGRELTDKEVIAEMEYLRDTFRFSGYDDKTIRDILSVVNYIIKKYKAD